MRVVEYCCTYCNASPASSGFFGSCPGRGCGPCEVAPEPTEWKPPPAPSREDTLKLMERFAPKEEIAQTAARVVKEYDAAIRKSTGRTAKHKSYLLELVTEALTFEEATDDSLIEQLRAAAKELDDKPTSERVPSLRERDNND